MKNLALIILAATLAIFSSCKKEEDPKAAAPTMNSINITGTGKAFDAEVTFSLPVYANNNQTGDLGKDAFTVTLAGGVASLVDYTVTHTAGNNTATISITTDVTANEEEIMTIQAVVNKIYNVDGVAMEATQSQSGNLSGVTFGTITKNGMITADETWTSNNIYQLDKHVVVDDGVTLTIEPGTIIKGLEGTELNASALVVARGGTLMAVGTPDRPIIFTTVLDNITHGQKVGTNLAKEDNRKWGGIVVLGKAPISAEDGDTEANIEGINPDLGYGKFGGDQAGDNSGKIKYISIRHGGMDIGDGNELNGLTLGGVGTGTEISDVEVYATLDDGIECFGGTVNLSNALVFFQGDDGIDLDMNYSGTISNFAVIHGDGVGTDEGLEIDGPEGSTHVNGLFTLTNGIVKSIATQDELSPADFKSKAQGNVLNVSFEGYTKPVKFRTKFDDNCDNKTDAYQHLVMDPATLVIADSKVPGTEVYDGDADDENPTLCSDALAADQVEAAGKVNLNGTGSNLDINATFDWTAAALRGEL
jgi:hypothetical protein